MTSWIDRINTEKADEFRLNRSLKDLENENVTGLKEVITSLENASNSGIYEDLKNAFDSRYQFYPKEKRMNYENMPENSTYSLAHQELGFIVPQFGRIMRFYFFCLMYRFIEFRYYMTVKREFSEEDIQNIYLSELDERLIFSLDQFDEVSNCPQPSAEFFQKLKNIKWEDKNTKKFAKKLKHLKIRIGYTHFDLAKYHHLSAVEEGFIELMAGCSAVNKDRDQINKEDIIIGYKTYIKLLNTDVTKYKARNIEEFNKKNESNCYLVCEKCNSYYKLQPGESPEDFTYECECGGKLKFIETINK